MMLDQRVLRQVYVWSNLAHENVLELLGITTNFDDTISIVSPLMPRGNASGYVQDPNVDPRPLVSCKSASCVWSISARRLDPWNRKRTTLPPRV